MNYLKSSIILILFLFAKTDRFTERDLLEIIDRYKQIAKEKENKFDLLTREARFKPIFPQISAIKEKLDEEQTKVLEAYLNRLKEKGKHDKSQAQIKEESLMFYCQIDLVFYYYVRFMKECTKNLKTAELVSLAKETDPDFKVKDLGTISTALTNLIEFREEIVLAGSNAFNSGKGRSYLTWKLVNLELNVLESTVLHKFYCATERNKVKCRVYSLYLEKYKENKKHLEAELSEKVEENHNFTDEYVDKLLKISSMLSEIAEITVFQAKNMFSLIFGDFVDEYFASSAAFLRMLNQIYLDKSEYLVHRMDFVELEEDFDQAEELFYMKEDQSDADKELLDQVTKKLNFKESWLLMADEKYKRGMVELEKEHENLKLKTAIVRKKVSEMNKKGVNALAKERLLNLVAKSEETRKYFVNEIKILFEDQNELGEWEENRKLQLFFKEENSFIRKEQREMKIAWRNPYSDKYNSLFYVIEGEYLKMYELNKEITKLKFLLGIEEVERENSIWIYFVICASTFAFIGLVCCLLRLRSRKRASIQETMEARMLFVKD